MIESYLEGVEKEGFIKHIDEMLNGAIQTQIDANLDKDSSLEYNSLFHEIAHNLDNEGHVEFKCLIKDFGLLEFNIDAPGLEKILLYMNGKDINELVYYQKKQIERNRRK